MASRRIGGPVRRRIHHGVRARDRRRARDDHDADHQSAGAATGRGRADHRDGAGVRGPDPGPAAPGPVQPATVHDRGRRPGARRGLRARVDAVPGPNPDRRDHRRLGHRRRECRPGNLAGDRLLPGAGDSVRAAGLRPGARGGRPGLAATSHPRHPDLRRRAADRGRRAAGHRRVERLRLLAAGCLRQRHEVADLMRLLIAVIARARNTWRTLTSMGTALVLLCLLALGAIPGALLPQRSLNAGKVDEYLATHPTIGPWLNRLQAFDVFSSFWFTAIYALLFVSLVGCLTPRMVEHARSMRATPVPAPRNLTRLPKHVAVTVAGEPDEVATTMAGHLRGWRTVVRRDKGIEISAEKGYLREFGNLVFHFSLLGLLVAVAAGKLFGYEGNVVVIADSGPGFCSASPAAFDSFRAGNTVDGTSLPPICLRVNDFKAHYLPSGQATSFAADIDYQSGRDLTGGAWRPYRLEVNHPLRVSGDRVYLQGHGYAPTFTVV